MEQEDKQSQVGRALIALGSIGLVLSFVGQGFLGRGAAGLFLPAVIVLFIGRSINRRDRRRSMDEVQQASQPVEKPRARPPQRRPIPQPQTKTPPPEKAKVESDLAQALAAYRSELPETEAPIPIAEIDLESLDFSPKSSTEMIEEARKKFNKE